MMLTQNTLEQQQEQQIQSRIEPQMLDEAKDQQQHSIAIVPGSASASVDASVGDSDANAAGSSPTNDLAATSIDCLSQSSDSVTDCSTSMAAMAQDETQPIVGDRCVQFGSVDVHVHPITLALPPAMPILGAPIQLGWNRTETYTVTVDEYESQHRHNHATDFHQLRISSSVRENWLKFAGYSRVQIEFVRNLSSKECTNSASSISNKALMDKIYGADKTRLMKQKSKAAKKMNDKDNKQKKAPGKRFAKWISKRVLSSSKKDSKATTPVAQQQKQQQQKQ